MTHLRPGCTLDQVSMATCGRVGLVHPSLYQISLVACFSDFYATVKGQAASQGANATAAFPSYDSALREAWADWLLLSECDL